MDYRGEEQLVQTYLVYPLEFFVPSNMSKDRGSEREHSCHANRHSHDFLPSVIRNGINENGVLAIIGPPIKKSSATPIFNKFFLTLITCSMVQRRNFAPNDQSVPKVLSSPISSLSNSYLLLSYERECNDIKDYRTNTLMKCVLGCKCSSEVSLMN